MTRIRPRLEEQRFLYTEDTGSAEVSNEVRRVRGRRLAASRLSR